MNDNLGRKVKVVGETHWIAGKVPVGMTGTIVEHKSSLIGMNKVKWDDDSLNPSSGPVHGVYPNFIPSSIVYIEEKKNRTRLYHYKEEEKVDGKTTRTGGSTKKSIETVDNHLHKVGTPTVVRGYLYKGRYGVNHVGVLVKGEKGSIRCGGFSWGYKGGEGVRGLQYLFDKLGIKEDAATIASWPNFNEPPHTVWELELGWNKKV